MDKHNLSKAIKALSEGKLIVYPTDTLYGIGADIFNDNAVKKVYSVKKRELSNPLSVAVSNVGEMEKIALVNENARVLAKNFLPGRLTLVLKKRPIVPDIVTAGLDNVAVRIPDNEIALELISKFGPITATSANVHEKQTPGVIKNIMIQFKKSDISFFIDDGVLEEKPSTIVDATSSHLSILREGEITKKQILDAIRHG